ncbi:synaptotagmin-like protein 2 isoform X2 [Labrus mixtus]|uniref:synaptotagmin-like protein 2 isoform X2 n=1 Tax=Labrus mixtus TaxID=508554 RepID=UPI0029BFCE49|nr:synaptotagmin-like protein 2 isoform X2 [Labrus mixtus]
MIDLSFLTEEEQETILAVLRRDAELKTAEEKRVQSLQRTVNDRDQLKNMTGEWFYETKQLRHHDRIHGADIIRASMRHTHKPLTIRERSHIREEKPSFVSSRNKEVFIPPVLRGVLQEPHIELSTERYEFKRLSQIPEHEPKLVSVSPIKERINPFNSEVKASNISEEKDEDQTRLQDEEPFPSSDSCTSPIHDLQQDPDDSQVTHLSFTVPPSEHRADSPSSEESFVEIDGGVGQMTSAAPRSILKHLSPSSSSDSLFPRLDPQSTFSPDSPSESWMDRKQVRFSSMIARSGLDRQDGKELGEHGLLDVDFTAPAEDQCNIKDSTDSDTHRLSDKSHIDSEEEELTGKNESSIIQVQTAAQHDVLGDGSGNYYLELLCSAECDPPLAKLESGKPVHSEIVPQEDLDFQATTTDWPDVTVESSSDSMSPEPEQTLLREEEEGAEEQTPLKEEVEISQEEETDSNHIIFQSAPDTIEDKCVEQQTELSKLTEVKTLQLTTMQNTPFKETLISVETDPESPSNLKASGEMENMISASEEAGHKDIIKTEMKPALCRHTDSDVESRNNNILPEIETTVEHTASTSQNQSSSPQTDCSLFVVLSKEDGTYRANPVVIYEETDDSSTGSTREPETSEKQENITTAEPPSVPLNSQKQEGESLDPLPRQSSPTPQEDRRAKISDLKNFWEKEVTKSREMAVIASSRSFRNKVVSPESDVRTVLCSREKLEGVGQTKSNTLLKSLNVTEKGFVSQCMDKTLLRDAEDLPSASHQSRVQADPEAQTKPLSPRRSLSPRANDQDEETRRSPSKTCHPRVLPKETSGPKSPRPEASPLKTFPIDIEPQSKHVEEQRKPTPVPRERKSPSHEARQTETKSSSDIMISNVNIPQSASNTSSPQHKKTPEKKLGTLTRLARSILPQDYQHYLGPQEKAYVPPFSQDSDALHSPQKNIRNSLENLRHSPIKASPLRKKDGGSSQDITTSAWSLSRPSSGSCDETPSTIMTSLKELSSKIKSSSKSLENLTSKTKKARNHDNPKESTNQSVDDVSSLPSSSNSKQLKSSVSVPVLQQDETDSDSTFETNLGLRRNTGSSTSNLSLSSGLASMSSVSGSIGSIYPADFGDIEVQGSIQFAVNYIQKLGEFHIFVVHCRDLAAADTKKNRSDPYVKCYLLPDKTKLGKRKTAVKKRTLNPDYNEILRFKIPMEELKSQIINISVWHNDTFGRNSFLGDVDLDLSEWDFSNTHINEYALKAGVSSQITTQTPSHLADSRGQMRVALRFLPLTSQSQSRMETSEVQIWVKDCKNLPPVRGVVIDPFVKCTVLPDTSRKSRQKTRVVKRTANPMFNHTMVYDGFRPEDLREACVEITVWDHDRLNNHYIGGVRLGLGTGKSYGVEVGWMDSTADEATLWQRMLQADGEWVEDVFPLRMLVMAKSMLK